MTSIVKPNVHCWYQLNYWWSNSMFTVDISWIIDGQTQCSLLISVELLMVKLNVHCWYQLKYWWSNPMFTINISWNIDVHYWPCLNLMDKKWFQSIFSWCINSCSHLIIAFKCNCKWILTQINGNRLELK